MTKNLTFLFGLCGVLLFAITSLVGGLQVQGYDPISQYISESYATGMPNYKYLGYAFMTSGTLLFLFGLLAPSAFKKSRGIKLGFAFLAIFYGLGTLATGFFPCDPGCPSDSANLSLSQFIHNTAGFLTYSVVPFCLIGLGISFERNRPTKNLKKVSIICGIISLVFVALLFGNPSGPFIGLFQRIVETSILFWILFVSFHILRMND